MTVVLGNVFVADAIIGRASPPCGNLNATGGGKHGNDNFDFKKLEEWDLCGKSACCYNMTLPDSAYLKWGTTIKGEEKSTTWEKKLKLPPYPPRKWNERYRVSFAIAYEDCVWVKIEAVPK